MTRYFFYLQTLLISGITVDALQINTNPIHTLLLCRHGDSIWNGGQPGTQETFTGWTDVPLSQKGIIEASNTGKEVSSYSYGIDACFTSILGRAKVTAHHCMWAFSEQPYFTHPQKYISDYRLNERHYGSLQGNVKHEVENGSLGYEPDLVKQWRRNWYAVPPLLDDNDPRRIEEVKKYSNFCGGADNVPKGESLQMVANDRIKPFLDDVLDPIMEQAAYRRRQIIMDSSVTLTSSHENDYEYQGGTGLVIAHANSLRALIGVICQVENDAVALEKLEAMKIQTGVPLVMKYRRSIYGEYEACNISGFDDLGSHQKLMKPDLPVWPLSCVPKKSLYSINNQSGFQSKSIDKKRIRIDVI
jgi:2,3-bisphosphoglycerate-dependent phosphoglycerate mutase